MNGEDDRSDPGPEKGSAGEAGSAPSPRRKKAKPPPNIITAGGVDMARGHAVGTVPHDTSSSDPIVHEPRVVLAVETDPRKVPTHKRLPAASVPDTPPVRRQRPKLVLDLDRHATPPTGAEIVRHGPPAEEHPPTPQDASRAHKKAEKPAAEPAPKKLPVWMRLSFAAVLVLLLLGIAQRLRTPAPAVQETNAVPVPVLPEPPAPAVVEPPRPVELHTDDEEMPTEDTRPLPVPTAAPLAAHSFKAPPPPPRATFTPPFQLPGEKH